MCGIAGIYDFEGKYGIDRDLLSRMTDTMAYRGPDDLGFYLEDRLGLGFRRLAIIDLETGNQPITNEDESVIAVCNGEIYNFKELRRGLESRGHRFKTRCDVEVLVHLYEDQGTEFLNQLNGQFAFAIFDKHRRTLFLARDHVGIAPLFYTLANDVLVFASEIKAILKHPLVRREVDLTGLDQILSFPGMISPRTMFKNIQSLPAGHYMLVQGGKIEVKEYWDLNYPLQEDIRDTRPLSEYVERLDELLREAVRYRLFADVPVGFYLSGGLDSSLTAALIRELEPGYPRHSFSISFSQANIDERYYQRIMAEQSGSIHHETEFDWQHISDRLRTAIYHAEAPLKESYNTCSLALSEFVRQTGIHVILTGEGADELFGGYVGYRLDQQRPSEIGDAFDLETMLEKELRDRLWGDPHFFYEKDFYRFAEVKTALYSKAVLESFNAFDCHNYPVINKVQFRNRHPVHKRSYVDFKLRLSDHLLADHGDRVAYANSVEARYPFLDINVIEFVRTIPPHLMLHQGVEKYILRQVAQPYLPSQILDREKFAFVAPGSPSLIRQDIEWVNDMLSYNQIKQAGYFNPDTIENLKAIYRAEDFTMNTTFDTDLLMIVLTFGIFKETFDIPDF